MSQNVFSQTEFYIPKDHEISYLPDINTDGFHKADWKKASAIRIERLFEWKRIELTEEAISFVNKEGIETIYWLKDFDKQYFNNDIVSLSLHGEEETRFDLRFREKSTKIIGELIDFTFSRNIMTTKYYTKYIF